VEKINSKPDDTHRDGARATVLSRWPEEPSAATDKIGFGYFVEWDDIPGLSVFIAAHRIRPIAAEEVP
jgi:hypothetical protein